MSRVRCTRGRGGCSAAPRFEGSSWSAWVVGGTRLLRPGLWPALLLCSAPIPNGDALRLETCCRSWAGRDQKVGLLRGRRAATRALHPRRLQTPLLRQSSRNLAGPGTTAALGGRLRSRSTRQNGRGSAGGKATRWIRMIASLGYMAAGRAVRSSRVPGLELRTCTPTVVTIPASATSPSCGLRSRVAGLPHGKSASCRCGALTGGNRRILLLRESERWSAVRLAWYLWHRCWTRKGQEGRRGSVMEAEGQRR